MKRLSFSSRCSLCACELACRSALCACLVCASAGAQQPPKESEPESSVEEDSSDGAGEAEPSSGAEADKEQVPDEPASSDVTEDDTAVPEKESPQVVAPKIVEEFSVELPPGEELDGTVLLVVTVTEEGVAKEIEVAQGISPSIDEAAKKAVGRWRFSPATRDGHPMAARIRVAVPIVREAQPESESAEKAPEPQPEIPAPVGKDEHPAHDHAHEDDVHMQVTVHGERARRTERRSASDYFLHREILEAAPHEGGAEMLRTAPGLTVFRVGSSAQGHTYSLRGFDAEHGQDIEFSVGGLPINMPAHIHGQGYADLNFLIGGVVDELYVTEGVSDPDQGDFAVAGTIRVGLGVDEEHRGLQMRAGYGSFNTNRLQLIWAPKEAERESFGAAQYSSTDGFGENRAARSASGLVQHRFGQGAVRYRAIGLIHAARGDLAGILRQEDVDNGDVCFHCSYPDATAQAQNALAQRLMTGLFADYRGPAHANGTIGFYVGRDHYRSQTNFTGYLEKSRTLGVSGQGDLIEQRNTTTTLGVTGRYRTEAFEPVSWAHGTIEVGLDARFDTTEQEQNLLNAAVRSQTWDERVDAQILGTHSGIWGDLDWQFGPRVQARVGARAAIFTYDVDDRLGNFAPASRPQDQFIVGFRRSAMGATVGPRSSAEVKVFEWLRLLGSYGEGYRSAQPRTLSDGENAPFAKVRSGDAGVRFRFGDPLDVMLTGYHTHLSDDVAFEASEGRLERIGPTSRTGAVAYATSRPMDWLIGTVSVTYVNAVLREPPPPTASEPEPQFEAGERLPFVSPLVVRVDASATQNLFDIKPGRPLSARVGMGFTYLAPRPLPFNEQGDPIPLFDASAGLYYGPVDLNLSAFNLFDIDYTTRDFQHVSDWNKDAPTSRIPARHFSAGAPLSLMATLGLRL